MSDFSTYIYNQTAQFLGVQQVLGTDRLIDSEGNERTFYHHAVPGSDLDQQGINVSTWNPGARKGYEDQIVVGMRTDIYDVIDRTEGANFDDVIIDLNQLAANEGRTLSQHDIRLAAMGIEDLFEDMSGIDVNRSAIEEYLSDGILDRGELLNINGFTFVGEIGAVGFDSASDGNIHTGNF